MDAVVLEYVRRPSTLATMARALVPSPGLAEGVPDIRARWLGHRVDSHDLAAFLDLTGIAAGAGLPVLYPHVFGFPLHMAVLTHPRFPVPIWRVLQIRNHLVQHARLDPGTAFDFETRVSEHRTHERGLEIDLATTAHDARGTLVWESIVTFYVRGRFGEHGQLSPLMRSPGAPDGERARWRIPARAGWRFGRFTGDHNGIHHFDAYARAFGFERALVHPPLAIGTCLARLPAPGEACRTDVWLKGPVHYGAEVTLAVDETDEETVFALRDASDPRPRILGRIGRRSISE